MPYQELLPFTQQKRKVFLTNTHLCVTDYMRKNFWYHFYEVDFMISKFISVISDSQGISSVGLLDMEKCAVLQSTKIMKFVLMLSLLIFKRCENLFKSGMCCIRVF